ncbi:hypothetical protein KIV10_13545 [Aequorivita echinoideorum]|uniref:Uncharacterized protein n=2 Tax=Aequorivita echinoideorum TaxID=1549647 RepID=A0ABS5S7L0_9FLAO|nr:hypothetical protein [Aequorivita echinoideorum]
MDEIKLLWNKFWSIFNIMKDKFKWIKQAYKSKVRITSQGDIYIKSKDVFTDKNESIKFVNSIAKATGFKVKNA